VLSRHSAETDCLSHRQWDIVPHKMVLRLCQRLKNNSFETCSNQPRRCSNSQQFIGGTADVPPSLRNPTRTSRRTLLDTQILSRRITTEMSAVSRGCFMRCDERRRDICEKCSSDDASRVNSESESIVSLNRTVGLHCRLVRGELQRTFDSDARERRISDESLVTSPSLVVSSLLMLVFNAMLSSWSCSRSRRSTVHVCWMVLFVMSLAQFACNARGTCVSSVMCVNTTECTLGVGFAVCTQNVCMAIVRV